MAKSKQNAIIITTVGYEKLTEELNRLISEGNHIDILLPTQYLDHTTYKLKTLVITSKE